MMIDTQTQPAAGPDDFTPEELAMIEVMKSGAVEPGKSDPSSPGSGAPAPAPNGANGAATQTVEKSDGAETGEGADKARSDDDDDLDPDEVIVDKDGKYRRKDGTFVAKSAYLRARADAKAAKQRITELETTLAKGNERLAQLFERLAAPEPKAKEAEAKAEEKPDPEKNIFAYVRWLEKQVETTQKQLAEKTAAVGGQVSSMQAAQAFQADALAFTARQADFPKAYEFLRNQRIAELTILNGLTPEQAAQEVRKEAQSLAMSAFERGKSPAAILYDIAKARGYAPPAPESKTSAEKTPAEQVIENIRKSKAAGDTLSGGGGAPQPELTVERLVAMSQDEFDKVPEHIIRKLLGGA
ncbi:MAG TPA: hypothetical protein VNK52_16110 [Hyphomicrobiaceae bacterium]|nr:hypothetical protein [Hyphomicrobiaceae bacterium]